MVPVDLFPANQKRQSKSQSCQLPSVFIALRVIVCEPDVLRDLHQGDSYLKALCSGAAAGGESGSVLPATVGGKVGESQVKEKFLTLGNKFLTLRSKFLLR